MGNLVEKSFSEELSIFKGKRVLVTGDTGFKGSWLSLWLHELGAEVMGLALPPETDNCHFRLLSLDKIIKHIDGDIRNESAVQSVVDDFQPEFLFHLAAQPLVRLSYDEPKKTFDTNVGGSVNILEAVRTSESLRSVIYVTSDKCYRNRGWLWGYRENDELGGHDPYSASKAAAEIVLASYMDSFFLTRSCLGVASVRAGNVIGGGDRSADRIVPDCIYALEHDQPIGIRNPNFVRPWQHVLEPLSGYLLLASKLYNNPKQFSGAWNFGPQVDSVQTVKKLAEKIIDVWGSGILEYECEKDAPHEAAILQLNCDKAHQLLGWHSQWGFNQAVEQTVQWYRSAFLGHSVLESTLDQIKLYMEEIK